MGIIHQNKYIFHRKNMLIAYLLRSLVHSTQERYSNGSKEFGFAVNSKSAKLKT